MKVVQLDVDRVKVEVRVMPVSTGTLLLFAVENG